MADLIKRGNKRAVKGKKRWRKNIDTTDLEQQLIEQHDKLNAQKNTQTLGFVIEERPNLLKRQKLEQNRFHKKEHINPSIAEKKKVQKYQQKLLQKNIVNDDKIVEQQELEEKEDEDIWQNKEVQKVSEFWQNKEEPKVPEILKLNIQKKNEVSRVVIPHAGQSYNPSFKSHQSLLNDVVAKSNLVREHRKTIGKKNLSRKGNLFIIFDIMQGLKQAKKMQDIINRTAKKDLLRKKFNSKEEKLQFEKSLAKKNQKQTAHSYNLLKKYKKEINKEFRTNQERQQEKDQENELILRLKKQGRVVKGEKLHKYKYRMQESNVVLEDDLPRNLRQIASKECDLVRDSFDSIYRRGLLESRERMKNIPKRKIPLYKQHTVYSKRDQNDEWENIEKEMELVN